MQQRRLARLLQLNTEVERLARPVRRYTAEDVRAVRADLKRRGILLFVDQALAQDLRKKGNA